MTALLLDGTVAAQVLLQSIGREVEELHPSLTIVQVGDDDGSNAYIRKKMEACAAIGVGCKHLRLPAESSFGDLLAVIHHLNTDSAVSGYIIQLQLPTHLSALQPQLFREMDPRKDVDGFTAYNLGKMFIAPAFEHLPPATPAGIIRLLEHYDIALRGKTAVIIGQSNIVGKPLSVMLKNRGVTTINCDVDTPPALLRELSQHYGEILVCAVGKPAMVDGPMIKPGAVVIDVGFSRTEDGVVGDVRFEEASAIASAITPVPGGVGPMTVAQLLANCVTAARRQRPI